MKKGLTLIELLIVFAILAILLIFSFGSWQTHLNKARDAQRKDDLQRLSTAFEEFYNDHNCYPPAGSLDDDFLTHCGGDDLKPYLNSIPCDPVTNKPYYLESSTCISYRILTILNYKQDPAIARLNCHTASACGFEPEYNYGITSGNITVVNPSIPEPSGSPSASAPIAPTPTPAPSPTIKYFCEFDSNCSSYWTNEKDCSPSYPSTNTTCEPLYCVGIISTCHSL